MKNPKVSAVALVKGMIEGIYTGKKLADYTHGAEFDFFGARAIINVDKNRVEKGRKVGDKIMDIALSFEKALIAADYGKPTAPARPKPVVAKPKQPKPAAPPVKKAPVGIAVVIIAAIGALTAFGSQILEKIQGLF